MKLKKFCDDNQHHRELRRLALTNEDWNQLENIISVLEPFNKYTKKLQKEEVTLSDFYGYWIMLRIKLSKAKDQLSVNLLNEMNKFHAMLMNNPSISAAIFLDPRYQRGLHENKSIAIDFLCNLHIRIKSVESFENDIHSTASNNITETVDDSDDNKSLEDLEEYLNACDSIENNIPNNIECEMTDEKKKIEALLNKFTGVQAPVTSSALEFWEQHKEQMPELYKLAAAIFAIPPTESSVECAFSALAIVLAPRRTRLGDDTLQNILIVRLNQRLFAGISKSYIFENNIEEN